MSERYSCGKNPDFGCGAYGCITCYPFTYRCECGVDYPIPIPNGERLPECAECGEGAGE